MTIPPALSPRENVGRESDLRRFFRESWAWVLVSVLFTFLPIIVVVLLSKSWPRLGAWGAAFGILAAFMAVLAHIYAMFGFYEAKMARLAIARTQEELVEMSLLLEEVTDYAQAFEGHVIRYTTPSDELTRNNGRLRAMRFLISTPVYGYHVLGEAYRSAFHSCLERTTGVPTEIIVYTPDSHFSHVANTILWQSQPCPSGGAVSRSCGDILAQELSRILLYIWSADGNLPFDDARRRFQLWATSSSNVRFSFFDFDLKPRAVLMLTDDVRLSSDLLRFSGRFVPIDRKLHGPVVRGPNPYFDQFKDCPYSAKTGLAAGVQPREMILLLSDYLWLRTREFVLPYSIFQSEMGRLRRAVGNQATSSGMTNLLGYFTFLENNATELGAYQVPVQQERITILRDIHAQDVTAVTPADFIVKLTPIMSFVTEALSHMPVQTLLSTVDGDEREQLLLFLLLSTGFGTSTYAART